MRDLAAGVLGIGEFLGGGGIDAGGGALCLSGAGCLAGAPALIAGDALIAHGTLVALEGASNLGRDLATLFSKNNEGGADKLPRYDGPKPQYKESPQHIAGRGLKTGKTPLPKDAEAVFKNAVPDSAVDAVNWYGKNSNGQTYRFSNGKDGTAHFSGIKGVGDGIRNITPYAEKRLKGL